MGKSSQSGRVPLIYLEILMLRIETEKIIKPYTYIHFTHEHSSHFYIIFSILNSNQTVQFSKTYRQQNPKKHLTEL